MTTSLPAEPGLYLTWNEAQSPEDQKYCSFVHPVLSRQSFFCRVLVASSCKGIASIHECRHSYCHTGLVMMPTLSSDPMVSPTTPMTNRTTAKIIDFHGTERDKQVNNKDMRDGQYRELPSYAVQDSERMNILPEGGGAMNWPAVNPLSSCICRNWLARRGKRIFFVRLTSFWTPVSFGLNWVVWEVMRRGTHEGRTDRTGNKGGGAKWHERMSCSR